MQRASAMFTFVCPLPSGLHARPASQLAEGAQAFASEAVLTNLRTGATANMKSVLAIIAADVRCGDECTVSISGSDERLTEIALRNCIEQVLPQSEVQPETSCIASRNGSLPHPLRTSDIHAQSGLPVCPGVGQGIVVALSALKLPVGVVEADSTDQRLERDRIERAIAAVRTRIRQKLEDGLSPTESAILKADLAIANDISLAEKIGQLISQGRSAGQAVIEAGEHFIALLRHLESEYIRERALDIQEICVQLLEEIYGASFQPAAVTLRAPSVVVAETLAPQQLLALDRKFLKALVLEYAGATSHAVILARSLGIPTVVGVKHARTILPQGRQVLVDAGRGLIFSEISPPLEKYYQRESLTLRRRREALARQTKGPAITADGKILEVAANVASVEEFIPAFEEGADGIGLVRTEMIFMGRDHAPSEDEQFAAYSAAATAAAGKPVIIRTLDIGGDKPLPYLQLPAEANPFLGYRGVRIYAEHAELLRTQLRAVLRASSAGRLQIMLPMVSSIEEVHWFKQQVSEIKHEMRSKKIAFDDAIPLGIMVEVPAAAFLLQQLCAELDFFSIGTNDLSQYFFAADRGNSRVAALSSVRHPAFLRFLKQIVDDIHAAGKWVGLCGDMGADVRNIALLVGLGLDEISVPAGEISKLKTRIQRLSALDCKQLLNRAVEGHRIAEVDDLVDGAQTLGHVPALLEEQFILLDSDAQNKEEAIHEIVDAFYVAGRTEDRQHLEEALWARESVYSTGLGFGFATPHCKTDAVIADSIGVLKLKQPIEWGSLDHQPVRMVILLAMRESTANVRHMQLFSKLARKLMNEEFREHLLGLNNAEAGIAYLSQQLDMET
jgi:phosphoenolpyruvate-protein phosphotransferase